MDDRPLSPSHVRDHLDPLGLTIVELPADTSTAALAARALNTQVATIVKSLLFFADGDPVLILAAGNRKVDVECLASDLGVAAVRLARPDEVARVTGYPVGGVPPVAHRRKLRTLVDRHLLGHGEVYAAAGAFNAVFAVSPRRLLDLTAGEITDCTR
jgi:prolyl-tRNA editing enzyme YbaK/EbsC (Cys-tRNA(Pro) deacylase)